MYSENKEIIVEIKCANYDSCWDKDGKSTPQTGKKCQFDGSTCISGSVLKSKDTKKTNEIPSTSV